MQRRMVSVIGGSDSNESVLKIAEEVGEELGRRGITVVCGGMGGVMEAVCRGAKKYDGLTIGILPSDSKLNANEFVDIAIPTGIGFARNYLVAKAGDAVIAICGKAGTLSEMAIAWFSDIPIVALSTSGGWAGKSAGTAIDERRDDVVYSAESAKEAVDAVFKALNWS